MDRTLPEVGTLGHARIFKCPGCRHSLSAEKHKDIAAQLRYTALPPDFIEKADLRIDPGDFRKQLLADEHRVIGRFDARVAGFNPDPLSESGDYDPSLPAYLAAYTATFNDYVRKTLKYETDRSYDVLTGRVQPWNFGQAGNGYLDVAPILQSAMIKSPNMKVMFCNGNADLATPYLAATYTIDKCASAKAWRTTSPTRSTPAATCSTTTAPRWKS